MGENIENFSRRERQIMDVIYRHGQATAATVMDEMSDAPGYSTVRTLLGVLEKKGHLRHERQGYHYMYFPTKPVEEVSSTMLGHVMTTFFEGSASQVVSAVLELAETDLTPNEYDELLVMIKRAKQEGR